MKIYRYFLVLDSGGGDGCGDSGDRGGDEVGEPVEANGATVSADSVGGSFSSC